MRARQKLSKPARRANGRLGHRNDGLGRERGPSIDSFVWPPASPFIVLMRNPALEILTVSENTFPYRFYAVQPSSLTVTKSPRLKKEKLKCLIPGIRHLSSPRIPGKSRPGWPEGTKTLLLPALGSASNDTGFLSISPPCCLVPLCHVSCGTRAQLHQLGQQASLP